MEVMRMEMGEGGDRYGGGMKMGGMEVRMGWDGGDGVKMGVGGEG